ncbi:MAG: DUF2321 domain-containing protein [Sporomusaceae bacterium]|nr:DUF2321 domain-containing protein [Sporomusaceae bacterium]
MKQFVQSHGAIICLSGHVIASSDEHIQAHALDTNCEICGSDLITNCPKCKFPIRGTSFHCIARQLSNGINAFGESNGSRTQITKSPIGPFKKPAHCYHCGDPYPWTEAAAREFEEIIELSDELDEVEKAILKEKFPFLISEQPGTISAALQINKILKPVMQTTGAALKSAVASKIAGSALTYLGWK